jgi:hypothetical protein
MGEVIIKISKDGQNVDVDGQGFVGKKCADFMKPIINALGEVQQEKKKPEFYKTEFGGVKTGH